MGRANYWLIGGVSLFQRTAPDPVYVTSVNRVFGEDSGYPQPEYYFTILTDVRDYSLFLETEWGLGI